MYCRQTLARSVCVCAYVCECLRLLYASLSAVVLMLLKLDT